MKLNRLMKRKETKVYPVIKYDPVWFLQLHFISGLHPVLPQLLQFVTIQIFIRPRMNPETYNIVAS